jgi:hypothetical protein
VNIRFRTLIAAALLPVAVSGTHAAEEQSQAEIEPVTTLEPCPGTPEYDSDRPRRRPGYPVLTFGDPDCDPSKVPAPGIYLFKDPPPVPDRWRIVDSFYDENLLDPYSNNNPLKGDKPVFGEDWFFSVTAISDTIFEPRRFPTPVGLSSTARPGSLDTIGEGEQYLINQNVIVEGVIYQGDTVFRPPDYEFRFTPVFNFNYTEVEERGAVKADPGQGIQRDDGKIAVQALFADKHLRNVSDRYDFDSIRLGIQPFSSDFRGFLFQDNQFGLRLFGTRDNNIYQYNLAWFRRLEKDTNSGLNAIDEEWRDDDVFIANVYKQDYPVLGFSSQVTAAYNRNREKGDVFFDNNNIIARPASLGQERSRDYDVFYLGYNGDGHFDRLNLTVSSYIAFGEESNGTFVNEETDIFSYFLAAEASRDFDWIRLKASFLHASGDDDPFDDNANGFDAIFENPQFAGGETSFFIRQNVPLIGGGKIALSTRNGVLPNLRSSKEHGQSNFTNPGLTLLGVGADLDLTPQTRLSFNLNQLWFAETEVLEVARNQAGIGKNIGQDISAALIWRPLATQNVVFRLSAAALIPGGGFKDLYGSETAYSILGNLLLTY